MATVGDVLSSALRLAGVLAAEESLSADGSETASNAQLEFLPCGERTNRQSAKAASRMATDESVTFGTGDDVSASRARRLSCRVWRLDYTARNQR